MAFFVKKAVGKLPISSVYKSLTSIPCRHIGLLSFDYPYFDKREGSHRNQYIHKTGERLEFYAKKLRDYYFEQGNYPTEKIFLQAKRIRAPYETIGYLWKQNEIPAVIQARDEFEPIDIVFNETMGYYLNRQSNQFARPWYIKVGDEEIRCTLEKIDSTATEHERPIKLYFNRYIPGRPNLLRLAVHPVGFDMSIDYQNGGEFLPGLEELDVWCYNDRHPTRIEVDCTQLTIGQSIKVGDIEKTFPDGLYLHRKYNHRRYQGLARMIATAMWEEKKNQYWEHAWDLRQEVVKKSSGGDLKREKKVKRSKREAAVPRAVLSAKFLMQEKKLLVIKEGDKVIDLEEKAKQGLEKKGKGGGAVAS